MPDGPTLASLGSAVLTSLGVAAPSPVASSLMLEPARAIVLLLVDGFGKQLLHDHYNDVPFMRTLPDVGPLTVGFPASTAISLASLTTGVRTGAHGIVGTSFRVDGTELLDVLRWTSHGAGPHTDFRDVHPPERIQPVPTLLERASAEGVAVTVISQREFRDSGLTRATLRGGKYRGYHALGDFVTRVLAGVQGPGPELCYAYHADLDLVGHLYGPGSTAWRVQLAVIDRLVEQLVSQLPADAAVLITGDHGMVAMDDVVDADTHPDLSRGVALLGGDARSRHVYADAGAARDVLSTWREVLGASAWVLSRDEAIDLDLFGPLSSHVAGRIGDVVTAARGRSGVIRSVAEPFISSLPGQHGSLSIEEQRVPLLVAHRRDP
ncbi:MAG: phosphodiesterase [Pseudonocardia sp. SCN 72-86]|nr:MAG: phosphodiesterase [Pseudonocardia sp. SCN 72-86]